MATNASILNTTDVMNTSCLNCSTMGQRQFPDTSAQERQSLIIYVVSTVLVAIGMVGIGCTVHYKILLHYLKRPKAFLTGVIAQLLLVPLIAWAMAKMFQMDQAEALGVMIQGSCPGGTTSNLVVYWMDGIVDLSVAMTGTTTLLAMGTLPLWLFIFQSAENITSFVIPFQELGITLACLVVPLAIGVFINAKFPKKARIISKVIITGASLGVLIILIVSSVLRRSMFQVSWKQVVVACLMPLVAYVIGYLATIIPGLKLNPKSRRTVALETALQNVQVAAAVIQLTFRRNLLLQLKIVLFSLLYYVFQVGYSAIGVGFIFIAKKKGWMALENDEVTLGDLEADQVEGKVNPTFKDEAAKDNQL